MQLVAEGLRKPQPWLELKIEKNVKAVVAAGSGVKALKFRVSELRPVLRLCSALKLAAVSWGGLVV